MNDPSQLRIILALGTTALATGILSAGGLLAYSVFMPRCQFWAPVVRSIPQREAVSLTFDDGPDERFTPQILDCLGEHNVKATFFLIGQNALRHPRLVQRIQQEGHVLGNHSLDHDHGGVKRNRDYWRNQIGETQRIIAEIVGRPPSLFRPPMGFKTWHIARVAREMRLPIIGWSVRGYDTRPQPPQVLASRLLRNINGHEIILLHDGVEPARAGASQQATVEALPHILAGIAEKKLKTLSILEALLPAESRAAVEATS